MGPFRFVHIADVHLDTAFAARRDDVRRRLREAAREAFRRAVDLTLRSGAHALLIAGDLFDQDRISFATERFLAEEFARLRERGISVCYACGNHDPGGFRDRTGDVAWSDVVVFADPEPSAHLVRTPSGEPVAWVSGAGHRHGREGDNLVAAFARLAGQLEREGTGPLPHVALVHAWVHSAAGGDAHDRYAPCTPRDLHVAGRSAGIAYWALGHVHERQEIPGEPPAHYPGNLMGRHFRETGAKGAYLVEVDRKGDVRLTFHPLAPVRWETVRLTDLADLYTPSELEQQIEGACRRIQAREDHRGDWLWRIELAGPCPLADRLMEEENLEDLATRLRDALEALHVEVRLTSLTRAVDPGRYRDGVHPLAVALELLDRAGRDDRLLDELAPPVLAGEQDDPALASDPARRREYLRELLAGLDREATARLLDPGRVTDGR